MLIRRHRSWELPESQATPESVFLDRRKLLAGMGMTGLLASAGLRPAFAAADAAAIAPELYPAKRNTAFDPGRDLTEEKVATSYNNFYEFGTSKNIHRSAQALTIKPWQVKIDGMVAKDITIDAEELIRKMPVDERLYRFRCVEAWSMTVPWSGFPLKALVEFAQPTSGAKYLVMKTFSRPQEASGQKQFWYPWPYTEGLTIEEATNDLAYIATGIYGKPLPRQNGAPLRLAVPWKYGFKSVKSIVQFTFTDKRPKTFWEGLAADEYGFWANVNPMVAHPRWSQATEEVIGSGRRIPTQLYNGYGEQVADLYKNAGAGEKLFM
ncbi:protein-methionine-sulfoxide reductase catalytic subunit MsrP [Ferrovibrio terrae]|uniref:Protein-methionine-sulfoxide reductase catalytic subunit MsrP n=1 Tax=Ferrovibrio terrae TaxID=2594003 RepID=A0A516H2M0_9PROT|nr:protein-methionine-sulfoxide reductase catalytic subunit MsrP [Ferrovibrio terrae]QDO97820.1 protein-methionine-sulfoxide reductase catalytic subunit MsrP [Ferrovibrio terrae]